MTHQDTRQGFLFTHLLLPVLTVGAVLGWLALTDGDRRLADAFFFDSSVQHWVGRNSYLANEFLHTGGRNLMRLLGVLAILGWTASYRLEKLRPLRRELGYLALCMALVPLTVGALKELTNVDCPWDLQGYGGDRPHVELFEDRPDDLPRAACFPGAHSSSAFALFALYFLWMTSNLKRARFALGAVLLIGVAFSVAQQSRGAHFLSHDLASALIAWIMCLGLYLRVLRPNGK